VIRCFEVIAEATKALPPDIEGVPYKIQFNCMSVPDTLSVSSVACLAFEPVVDYYSQGVHLPIYETLLPDGLYVY